jgi:hypothetical protein
MALNTRTLGDVKTAVRRQFGDESGYQVTDEDIIRWTNQAQMEIVAKNDILKKIATQTLTAGSYILDKPNDTLKITTVKDGTSLLKSIGLDEFMEIGYRIDGSAYDRPSVAKHWTQLGDTIIIGGSSEQDVTITLVYVPEPGDVAIDSDVLALPDKYYNRVLEFVMAKAYELDEDWTAHNTQRQLFEQNLTTQSNEENDTSGPYPTIVDYDYL